MNTGEINQKIAIAREKAGLTQAELANKVPCATATISRIETGNRTVTMRMLYKIAKALDIDPAHFIGKAKALLSDDAVMKELRDIKEKMNFITVPIIGSVPAGHPEIREQQILGNVCLSIDDVGGVKKDFFALKISGESLNGDGIHSGDVAVFDPHPVFQDGKIYVLRLGNEVVVRHVYKSDGTVSLVSSNQEFKAVKVKDVEILGKLVWLQRSY
jgi:repressor LexA